MQIKHMWDNLDKIPIKGTSEKEPRWPGMDSNANFISPTSINNITDIDRSVMIPRRNLLSRLPVPFIGALKPITATRLA